MIEPQGYRQNLSPEGSSCIGLKHSCDVIGIGNRRLGPGRVLQSKSDQLSPYTHLMLSGSSELPLLVAVEFFPLCVVSLHND